MRIAIICTLYPPYVLGGAEISVSLLAEKLVANGHKVSVLTTGNKYSEEIQNGVKVYRIKNKNIYWRYPQRDKNIIKKSLWHLIDIFNWRYKEDIKNIIYQINPDIVNTSNLCGISSVAWDIVHKMNIPIVHTLRDYYLLCPQQTMIKGTTSCKKQCMICKTYSIFKKKMSQKVDAVVGISDFILQQHLRLGYFRNASKKVVISNSINIISETKPHIMNTFGYIGRLSPEKGIEFMIEAFRQSTIINKKLLIAGTGNKEYEQTLRAKYASENVIFLGLQKQVSFFKMIDLLIVPSLWNEPFGRVVIEAYASKTPVFMASNGGLKELQVDNISWCFDTNDIENLTKLIDKSNCLHIDNAKFEKIVSKYSKTVITKKYEDLFLEIISNK